MPHLFRSVACLAAVIVVLTTPLESALAVRADLFLPKGGLPVRHPMRKKIKTNIPGKERWQYRNEQRRSDLKFLGNAFYNYRREHNDENVPGVGNSEKEICKPNAKSCKGLLDVTDALKPYMKIPIDPLAPVDGNGTGYFARKDWKGRIFLTAPLAEEDWSIRVMH